MRIQILILAVAACVLAVAAWLVQQTGNSEQQANAGAVPAVGEKDRLASVPEKYRATAEKALAYLVKHQHKDGHWEGDGGKHPVAVTGLVGVALLMEADHSSTRNNIGSQKKYGEHVRKAADWLMKQCEPKRDGLIFSGHDSETDRYMEGHGLATLFLAGVCRHELPNERRKEFSEVLTRAVKYIARAQSSKGGWYHTSKVEGHDFDAILPTAIQIQALQAASNAGIAIPGDLIRDGKTYLHAALANDKAKLGTEDVAAALASRFEGGRQRREGDALVKKWIAYCLAEAPVERPSKQGRDEITHYFFAQAVYWGERWESYRTALFDRLQRTQNTDGSWPAAEGISVGSIYSTAIWCTVMLLDRNSHPTTQIPVNVK